MTRAIAILVLMACSGCATIVTGGGHNQSVRFTSTAPGVRVFVDENFVGMTPISANLTRADDHRVRAESPGGAEQVMTIGHGPNLWIFGNILFGGIIGVGVDLISGAAEGALYPNNAEFKFTEPIRSPRPVPVPIARVDDYRADDSKSAYDNQLIREVEASSAHDGYRIEPRDQIVRISAADWWRMGYFDQRNFTYKMSDYFYAKTRSREAHIRNFSSSTDLASVLNDGLHLDR